ncbi:MAG: hypothetical protein WCY89_05010 [Flavobacteriaceae bacterium]
MDKLKLKQILFNIHHICTHIEISNKEIKRLKLPYDNQVRLDVDRVCALYICNLLDELKVFDNYVKSQNNDYLYDTFYVLEPLIEYLNKFDSFRIKRNKVLAHHNRDGFDKKFTPWWKKLIGKRFPASNEELNMVYNIVKIIHKTIEKRFKSEYDESIEEFNTEIDKYEEYVNTINPPNNVLDDISMNIKETQKRMREKGFNFLIVNIP